MHELNPQESLECILFIIKWALKTTTYVIDLKQFLKHEEDRLISRTAFKTAILSTFGSLEENSINSSK